jgi:flagellar assembly factor FliW
MLLDTTRFGTVEIDDSAVITLTHPIIGFQEFRRFVLMPVSDGSPVVWLQSTESSELAFLLMDPRQAIPSYQVRLGPDELAELAVTDAAELSVYTLVVVPRDRTQIRTNLKAPILINAKHRLGKQTIVEHGDYPVRHYLADERPLAEVDSPVAQELSNARTHS